MAGEGDLEVKGDHHPDPARDYEEEKIRMKTAKTLMTKKIKRLENAISDYEEAPASCHPTCKCCC